MLKANTEKKASTDLYLSSSGSVYSVKFKSLLVTLFKYPTQPPLTLVDVQH